MSRIISHLDTTSANYRHNRAEMTHRVQALRELTHKVRHERPARDVERLHRQKKLTVRELFMMSAATRCIVQSLLILPASNDDDTLLLLPSLFVGSAAQLRSLLHVFFVTFSSS